MKYVNYEDFGAKGNGKVNDFNAIKAAHEYANEHNLPIRTNSDAVYYIGDTDSEIPLMTDTDWNTSKFIIDDRNITDRRLCIFMVSSSKKKITVKLNEIYKSTNKLDLNLPCKSQLIIKNDTVRHYIRFGLNQNNGIAQTDSIIVDKDGSIIVPTSWDFETVTSVTVIPIDETTLHITGGIFTTIANYDKSEYTYYSRNIFISRSNVIINGITHYIKGERDHGSPYGGFINASQCSDITLQNSFFTGHKIYQTIGSAGKPVSMGSYDLSFDSCINLNLINCRQINIRDTRLWGLFGSNHCKNLVIDGCYISRVDAHMGVTNYTIKNTTLGWQGLNAIGHGLLTVDNVTSYSNSSFINLRSDYGSTWDGNVVIKNSKWHVAEHIQNPLIISGYNSGEHDFGYQCYLPNNIKIDGLTVENIKGELFLYNNFAASDFMDKPYPYKITENIICHNIIADNGAVLQYCANPDLTSGINIKYLDNH